MRVTEINGCDIRLIRGDITEQEVDAIVNAANSSLLGGGGVDGAIHRKGGKIILDECKRIRRKDYPDGLPPGEAVITSAGELRAKHVIHTVGPVWRGGGKGERETLYNAYHNSLTLAFEEGLRTVAFPSISTGAYGYPLEEASRVALTAIRDFLEENGNMDRVEMVCFSEDDMLGYIDAAESIF
jgi:O-acetyl-ADP-ribose deacetylase (regulator of RNase III)